MRDENRMDSNEVEFMSDEELAAMEFMLHDIEDHPYFYPEIELIHF